MPTYVAIVNITKVLELEADSYPKAVKAAIGLADALGAQYGAKAELDAVVEGTCPKMDRPSSQE
jgi:hypothetical protein